MWCRSVASTRNAALGVDVVSGVREERGVAMRRRNTASAENIAPENQGRVWRQRMRASENETSKVSRMRRQNAKSASGPFAAALVYLLALEGVYSSRRLTSAINEWK